MDPTKFQKASDLRFKAPSPRITSQLSVHYEPMDEQAYSIEPINSHINVENREDVYSRKMTVGPDWQPIQMGPFEETGPESIGLVIIESLNGRFPSVNPTDEERKEELKKIIEVSLTPEPADSSSLMLVLPWPSRLPYFGKPTDVSLMRIRSQSGEAKCRIYLFPR
jgi:hypothetical protein